MLCLAKWFVFGQNGMYFAKQVVFDQIWVVFDQMNCIFFSIKLYFAKLIVFGHD